MADTKALALREDLSTEGMAQHLVKSGYFRDVNDQSKAVVKLLAGRELGMPPVASLMNVYIVDGKVTLSATMMGALIKKSERYDYTAKVADDCVTIIFKDRATKEVLGESSFSLSDAKAAGLAGKQNWAKYPKAMMFARALSQGARWYCPDIFAGAAYTPEEIAPDTNVNEEGVPTATVEVVNQAPAPEPVVVEQPKVEDAVVDDKPKVSGEVLSQIADLVGRVPEGEAFVGKCLKKACVAKLQDVDAERGELILGSLKAKAKKAGV